jgi:hypothetical protein
MSGLRIKNLPTLSPSQVSKLNLCQRRWWWERNGLREGNSEPTAMGTGMATALEFGSLKLGLKAYHAERPRPDQWTDPAADARQVIIAENTIRLAYEGYVLRWPDPVGSEREATSLVDIPGTDTFLQVRTDLVVPGSHLGEDKLRSGRSMQPQKLEHEVLMGQQTTSEIYVHWRVHGELLPVHLRCVKKIDPRKLKGSKEKPVSVEEIPAILEEHFTGANSDSVFQEYTATRTIGELQALERELAGAADLARELKASVEPAGLRNLESCTAFGRECPALAKCLANGSTDTVETERLLDLTPVTA